MLLKTGQYTGDGNDNRSITGIGFEPDAVFIWKDSSTTKVFRTNSGFSGDQTTTFGSTTGLFAGAIQALESDGFQIGTHTTVNDNGATYFWIAIKDDGNSDFAVGNYTGDGNDDRDITVGFVPKFVIVKRVSGGSNTEMRVDSMAADESWGVASATLDADHIQDFGATTFEIGTSAPVNASGATYAWIAFGFGTATTYVGNGADNRSITGSGFDPEFLVLKAANTNTDRAKIDAIVDEKTLKFESAALAATNEIQALITNGFQIGSDGDVNTGSRTYHYFTTKTNPVAAGGTLLRTLGLMGVGR